MIKKLLFSLFTLSLLAACSQDELPTEERFGYLSLGGITIESAKIIPATRAVEDGLYVEILKGDSPLYTYDPGAAPESIKLPVGTYTVKAYNEAYLSETKPENELGSPIFYADTTINITEGATQTLELKVPLTNLGIRFTLDEGIAEWFKITLTITLSDQKVFLQPGETLYLASTDATGFDYSLNAENTDGESNTAKGTYATEDGEPLAAGKIYEVKYSVKERLEVSNN